MPLINGMKMACEPCIRGHRSTKCTHANERLMVPVRKPGRPLSACPHPRDSPCGCGSVTAAIPRKQACHCGTSTPPLSNSRPPTSSSSSEAPSPKQFTFKVGTNKVGKPAKPSSSRKQSFDPSNFERMDMSQMNVMSFEQRPHMIASPIANGYTLPGGPQLYGFPPQYPNFQAQFNHLSMQILPDNSIPQNGINGYGNGMPISGSLEHVIESPLITPTGYETEDVDKLAKNATIPTPKEASPERSIPPADGGSCCASRKNHDPTPSVTSIPEASETAVASCCSGKAASRDTKAEPISNSTLSQATPQPSPLIIPHSGLPFGHPMYQQYPQTTLFTYPPTYGSFQNPLQPQAWLQSIRDNIYGQQPVPLPPGPLPFNAPVVPESLDTIHSCCCGDTCQCIGCAAHPYNDATQDYVRSAWASMSLDRPTSEMYTNGQPKANGNDNGTAPPQPVETVSSPTVHTPSSTASANGEEQSLSAADFFFVNYPFTADGCGGDTQSCPCGDDCQCLGCTIHRQPGPAEGSGGCCGEKESCDCGDDCQCVGCEFHGNA